SRRLETSQWIESRRKFLLAIAQQLPRRLMPYEVQMIIFAKSCHICHQQIYIHSCGVCHSDNYCLSHVLEFKLNHPSKCHELTLCLNLNILYVIPIEFERLIHFLLYRHLLHTERKMDLLHSAGPQYVIHVISANYIEYKYMKAWELLHHLLWWIRDVTVVLIGKELITENINLESCNDCKSKNRRISVVCRPGLYDEYMRDLTFHQPNVIITFQAHFDQTNIWRKYCLLTSQ
ncbi:uncharacterized protein LOC116853370, partial [Odontomachus brunneus]|uniref:uncharacterized protein LOC116853370 n=1 Tax=Odontomachus brunneus TaxID=486640 RepID=UPI0013F22C7D